MNQTEQALSAIAGIPLAIVVLIVLGLTFLLPVYVATISGRIGKLLKEAQEHSKASKQLLEGMQTRIETNTRLMESHGSHIGEQLQANNALTRQLLRAYGHEPEA